MKVLLIQDIKNIGKKGETKEAADGFAINFLIPKKLAIAATAKAVANWRAKEEKERRAVESNLKKEKALAARLQGLEIVIETKAAKDGKLFGGISAAQIAELLNQKGLAVEKNNIIIEKTIKSVGQHRVKIKLSHGLETGITVIVDETKD